MTGTPGTTGFALADGETVGTGEAESDTDGDGAGAGDEETVGDGDTLEPADARGGSSVAHAERPSASTLAPTTATANREPITPGVNDTSTTFLLPPFMSSSPTSSPDPNRGVRNGRDRIDHRDPR